LNVTLPPISIDPTRFRHTQRHRNEYNAIMSQTAPRRRLIFSLRTLFVVTVIAALLAKGAIYYGPADALDLVILWGVHAILPLVVSSPLLYLGRHRAKWQAYDLLALVLPFLVWLFCMAAFGANKSLSNLGECFLISIAIPFAAATRIALGYRQRQWIYSAFIIFALCLVAVAIYFLIPSLPE
jgi:hypothetical protein